MNDLEELFFNKQESLIKEMVKTTILFFIVDENKKPNALGTGVLVKIESDYYIWTAAHVIDNDIRNIAISISGNKAIYPGGVWIKNENNDRNNDDIDVAILKLNSETTKDLIKHYTFLDEKKILFNHKVEELPLYSINGFPSKMNKPKYKEENINLNIFCHSTSGISNPDEYTALQKDVNKSILLNYNKSQYLSKSKKTNNSIALNGMSGCGLWYYKFTPSGGLEYFLVGIFNERALKNHQRLIASRTDIYIGAIRRKFNQELEI
ncbi:hypothetical protein [Lacinutrix sp. MEBiC02595]